MPSKPNKPITAARVRTVLRRAKLYSSMGDRDGYRVRTDGVDGQVTVDVKGDASSFECVRVLRAAGIGTFNTGRTVIVGVYRD